MSKQTETTDGDRPAHDRRLMGKAFLWSGWALAFLALFLGSYILNKMHLELMDLQQQNMRLKTKLQQVQAAHRHP